MAWQRSDTLALWALVVSIVSLLASGVVSILTFRYEYGEDLSVEMLPLPHNFVHAYSFERSPDSPATVHQVAAWYHVRLNNRSNKSISVVDAYSHEDVGQNVDLPSPFVSSVFYESESVSLGDAIRLPLRLEAGEAKELYALLPMTVTNDLGRLLVPLMRAPDDTIDTQLETVLFLPNYFANLRQQMLKDLRDTKLAELMTFHDVQLGRISPWRELLSVARDGGASFRDAKNDAPDGFRFQDGLELYNQVAEKILGTEGLNFKMIETPFRRYAVIFRTSGGGHYEIVLRPGKLPLERMAP